jgi:hypothetical protein
LRHPIEANINLKVTRGSSTFKRTSRRVSSNVEFVDFRTKSDAGTQTYTITANQHGHCNTEVVGVAWAVIPA